MSDFVRQLPPLSTLVVFEAAVRLLSFSRAADECALSQSSVSRQMRQLENNLDTLLFERQRYDVVPTEAGEKFYQVIRQALGNLATAATELRDSENRKKIFTIYSDLSIAMTFVVPLIDRLQKCFPEMKFNIISSYEPIEQTRSAFDIGFQMGWRAEELFDIETIADDLIFPVCSPMFAQKFEPAINAEKLSKLPLLHLKYDNNTDSDWYQFLTSYCISQCKLTEELVFSSYQVCLEVAERGEGVALGWKRSVNSKIAEGRLVRFTDMSLQVTNGVSVYQRKNADPHPLSRKIIEEVRHSISS